jgi:uncharacterized protein YbjT (DUF2867 family)
VRLRDPVPLEDRFDGLAAPGVEAVVGDLERPETLPGALSGAARVFLMSRDDPNQPDFAMNSSPSAARPGGAPRNWRS